MMRVFMYVQETSAHATSHPHLDEVPNSSKLKNDSSSSIRNNNNNTNNNNWWQRQQRQHNNNYYSILSFGERLF